MRYAFVFGCSRRSLFVVLHIQSTSVEIATQIYTPPLDQYIDTVLCILSRTLETLIPYRVLLIPIPVDQVFRSFTQVGFAAFLIQIH